MFAQQADWRFSHLGLSEGLADNWVHCALMDSRGMMWFGTNEALSFYDGHHFKHYRNNSGDSTALQGLNILDLAEDEKGDLWLATIGGGLNRMSVEEGTFTHFPFPLEYAYDQRRSAISLLLDPYASIIWLGTFNSGLHRFDKTSQSFQRYDLHPNIQNKEEK